MHADQNGRIANPARPRARHGAAAAAPATIHSPNVVAPWAGHVARGGGGGDATPCNYIRSW